MSPRSDPVGFRLADAEFHELIGTMANNAFLDRVRVCFTG